MDNRFGRALRVTAETRRVEGNLAEAARLESHAAQYEALAAEHAAFTSEERADYIQRGYTIVD